MGARCDSSRIQITTGRSATFRTATDGSHTSVAVVSIRPDPMTSMGLPAKSGLTTESVTGGSHRTICGLPSVRTDPIGNLQRTVQDLLTFGCVILTVQVMEACGGCQRPQVIGSASLGGVEAMTDRQHMLDMVADLVTEALADAKS